MAVFITILYLFFKSCTNPPVDWSVILEIKATVYESVHIFHWTFSSDRKGLIAVS